MTNETNAVDQTDDRQEAVLRAKAWKDAAKKEAEVKAEPIAIDDRQEAIKQAKAWSKPIAKIVKKIKKKGKN